MEGDAEADRNAGGGETLHLIQATHRQGWLKIEDDGKA